MIYCSPDDHGCQYACPKCCRPKRFTRYSEENEDKFFDNLSKRNKIYEFPFPIESPKLNIDVTNIESSELYNTHDK
jgi:hypothetical protein